VIEVGHKINPRVVSGGVADTLGSHADIGGSGAEYLHSTVVHLKEHGIHDRALWKLQELVAKR
jgi:glutathione-specific gamma-glutamylcyclotransferase